jgi:hypothetical protein
MTLKIFTYYDPSKNIRKACLMRVGRYSQNTFL